MINGKSTINKLASSPVTPEKPLIIAGGEGFFYKGNNMAICPLCKQWYDGVEIPSGEWNDPTDGWCSKCISDEYNSYMQQIRNRTIHFNNELVLVGAVEAECSGNCLDGELYDLYIKINGQDVYGLLDEHIQDNIDAELLRRVKSGIIIDRCKEIEKELIDSDDPATLRLERSELDGQLEAIEQGGKA